MDQFCTSRAEDDSQIWAVPCVAWAMLIAGHQVTILVDASAVTWFTKGFEWVGLPMNLDTTAHDRAKLPEGERITLAKGWANSFIPGTASSCI